MNKQPNAFAVYPDSVRMDIAAINKLSAIFKYEAGALFFAQKMWANLCEIKPIYSPHFDPDYKESEFTAGQEVEVSDNGKDWAKRFYIGKNKNGMYVAENDKTILDYWEYCQPIKEKVTYYVYLNKETDTIYTHKYKPTHERFELIHSFTI